MEIKHDDKLNEEDGVFVQVALLYTSCSGQRRVRILNLALTCCSQMADLFRHCELDTLINYWAKAGKLARIRLGNRRRIPTSFIESAALYRTVPCHIILFHRTLVGPNCYG